VGDPQRELSVLSCVAFVPFILKSKHPWEHGLHTASLEPLGISEVYADRHQPLVWRPRAEEVASGLSP